jgi:hypothetical protein
MERGMGIMNFVVTVFSVHERLKSRVKREEFVSDRMPCTIPRSH